MQLSLKWYQAFSNHKMDLSAVNSLSLKICLVILTGRKNFVDASACNTSSCPFICKSCPSDGDSPVPINPSEFPHTCQEVIVETRSYPNGYTGDDCRWSFAVNPEASFVATFLDFDGEHNDIILIIRMRVLEGGAVESNSLLVATPSNFVNRTVTSKGHRLDIYFRPDGTSFRKRGLKMRILFAEEDSATACSMTDEFNLTPVLRSAAIASPNFPGPYPSNVQCFYHVTSPTETEIILEFVGNVRIQDFEDYLFVFDVTTIESAAIVRVVSQSNDEQLGKVQTGTNRLRLVFIDHPGTEAEGFFIHATFQDVIPLCNGNGLSTDYCACSTVGGGPICAMGEGVDFSPKPSPTMDSDLTHLCSDDVTEVHLGYTSEMSSALLATPFYFSGAVDPGEVSCSWVISGPPDSAIAVIIRAFSLELKVDTFRIALLRDGNEFNFLRYSSSLLDLPLSRDGDTFSVQDTPIVIDSNMARIDYNGNTNDFSTFKGVLFEVHLLGKGTCTEPCLNGGKCEASCHCHFGFQGNQCEHSIPPDYTCLVKNPYVPHNFVYPIMVFAIAGFNNLGPEKFTFNRHHGNVYQDWSRSLPENALIQIKDYGSVLSMPVSCSEEISRFGVFSCIFEGDDVIDRVTIPAVVNPVLDYLTPIGRPTKTSSIGKDVTFSVEIGGGDVNADNNIKWRHNGPHLITKWAGQSTITISDVSMDDAGIYECFMTKKRTTNQDFVTYRLIVRACPHGLYGPPSCIGICPECMNGGTCHDEYGTCVCPPGYSGTTCEKLLNQNNIGRNRGLTCPGAGISYPGCKYLLFCLPDPGGCMCMPGWTGNTCDKACGPLKFGLECQFDCHCNNGEQCDVATGACPSGCDESFTGSNCQLSSG